MDLQRVAFALLVRPFVRWVIGMRVEGRENLPASDPFVLVANHNSHLDTPILLCLLPGRRLSRMRPVAAADYWTSSRFKRWASRNLFHILPIERRRRTRGPGAPDLEASSPGSKSDPLEPLRESLRRGESLLIFPEGTRGEPEVMGPFRSGVAHLLKDFPEVVAVPIHLANAGRSLPREDALFVPFVCTVMIGAPRRFEGTVKDFQHALEEDVRLLGEL